MKTSLKWTEGMAFDGSVNDHVIRMDAKAPLGKESGATPKELVALGLGGCTAMDVIALLKKYKQLPKKFLVDVEVVQATTGQPSVFESSLITFIVEGEVEAEKLNEAVRLSQTKYCGVSAMLSKSFPIDYRIILNGNEIGSGKANF